MGHAKKRHLEKHGATHGKSRPYWALLSSDNKVLDVVSKVFPTGRDAYIARGHARANKQSSKLLIGVYCSSFVYQY